jgi:hypothetical protein
MNILKDTSVKIKTVIIPIRIYTKAAQSRVKNTIYRGGLWNATDEISQIQYYNKIMADYMFFMTKYEINTIFIDFDNMITNKKYLFDKIKNILDEKNIDFDRFSNIYDEVSLISRPV